MQLKAHALKRVSNDDKTPKCFLADFTSLCENGLGSKPSSFRNVGCGNMGRLMRAQRKCWKTFPNPSSSFTPKCPKCLNCGKPVTPWDFEVYGARILCSTIPYRDSGQRCLGHGGDLISAAWSPQWNKTSFWTAVCVCVCLGQNHELGTSPLRLLYMSFPDYIGFWDIDIKCLGLLPILLGLRIDAAG